MTAKAGRSLFSWDDVERLPDLRRLEFVLRHLPDENLLRALNERRGRGRDDYPVAPMWRALVAGVAFQHPSIAALVRELRRNPALLDLCGFSPLPRQGRPTVVREAAGAHVARLVSAPLHDGVPGDANFSRMLRNLVDLEEREGLVGATADALRRRLMDALPDFGRHPGVDGKALSSHSTGNRGRQSGKASDPDADWGRHGTGGVGRNGKAWTKVKAWFGYGLHLVAAVRHEVPVAFAVSKASAAEQPQLAGLPDQLAEREPELLERCRDFSADRGHDSGTLKRRLWDEHRIRPLIDARLPWREEGGPDHDPAQPILRPLFPDRADNILHSERGEVTCQCPATGARWPSRASRRTGTP